MSDLPPARACAVSVNHVGLTVTDLDAAVAWYQDVLGAELIRGPVSFDAAHSAAVPHRDVFGADYGGTRIAFLTTANAVGIELFQFLEPPTSRREQNFEYWKTGIFHLCVGTGDVPAMAARIAATGGRQRSELHETRPGVTTCYCEDPDGNVLELTSASFEVQNANRGSLDVEAGLHSPAAG